MSRPLQPDPKRVREATQFHRDVFATYGGAKKICALCNRPGASDAAHVIPRSKLGPLRYADVRFARPAHRLCHDQVDRHIIEWPIHILADAISAHNQIAKVKLQLPVLGEERNP